MPEESLPRQYRCRPHKRIKILAWSSLPIAAALLKTWVEPLPIWLQVSTTIVLAAATAWVVYAAPRRFTTVNKDGISVRGAYRTRHLAWNDIYDIRNGAGPHTRDTAYAHLANGRQVLLPYVDRSELGQAGFLPEVAALQVILAEHRTTTLAPDPGMESRIARWAARAERPWQWVEWLDSWKSLALILATALIASLGIACLVYLT
ncbi:PH domain-containing protein [Streptomyces sp. NPDC054904]